MLLGKIDPFRLPLQVGGPAAGAEQHLHVRSLVDQGIDPETYLVRLEIRTHKAFDPRLETPGDLWEGHLNPLKSKPHPWLVETSLAVVAIAATLPSTPLGVSYGFVALPVGFFLILIAMVAVYLLAAEVVKRWFYLQLAKRKCGVV